MGLRVGGGCTWTSAAPLQARPAHPSRHVTLHRPGRRLLHAMRTGDRRGREGREGRTEKDNTGAPRSVRLRMKNSGYLNISNNAHNLLIDIGSLTLKKETMKHDGRTRCFVKDNVESYFCCSLFILFFILVCSLTSYMLWSLYVWHSEMVTTPSRSLRNTQTPSPRAAWERELFPESLSSRRDLVPKTAKTQERRARCCLRHAHQYNK